MTTLPGRPTILSRFLAIVERGGNALPHPATLFAIMALLVVLGSAVAAQLNVNAVHPGTGQLIEPVSLLSISGLHRIMRELVTNFTCRPRLSGQRVGQLLLPVHLDVSHRHAWDGRDRACRRTAAGPV